MPTFGMVGSSGPVTKSPSNYSVGVYYYPGWKTPGGGGPNPSAPWSIIPASRYPLIGAYPEEQQWVCDSQVQTMQTYGIDYVAVDCYWQDSTDTPLGEYWLVNYMKSTVVAKPKLSLLWDNTGSALTSTHFLTAMNYWYAKYGSDSKFYRINGRPVIYIFNVGSLLANAAGNSPSALVSLLNTARSNGNWYFIACSNDFTIGATSPYALGFDAISAYNQVGGTEWNSLNALYTNYYKQCLTSPLPTILPIGSGWDATPWAGIAIAQPTISQFTQHVQQARSFLNCNSNQPMLGVVVDAWNEYGEGSYIEPATDNGGTARLQAIQTALKYQP